MKEVISRINEKSIFNEDVLRAIGSEDASSYLYVISNGNINSEFYSTTKEIIDVASLKKELSDFDLSAIFKLIDNNDREKEILGAINECYSLSEYLSFVLYDNYIIKEASSRSSLAHLYNELDSELYKLNGSSPLYLKLSKVKMEKKHQLFFPLSFVLSSLVDDDLKRNLETISNYSRRLIEMNFMDEEISSLYDELCTLCYSDKLSDLMTQIKVLSTQYIEAFEYSNEKKTLAKLKNGKYKFENS